MQHVKTGRANLAVLQLILCGQVFGQPAFAVASVKAASPQRLSGRVEFKRGGRISAVNVSILQLVNAAYGFTGKERVERNPSLPGWVASARFDIEAFAEEGSIPDDLSGRQLRRKLQPMLQQLLKQRFKMLGQKVEREAPVFLLTVAPTGAKLPSPAIAEAECRTSEECHKLLGDRMQGLRGSSINMADLTESLESISDRPIVDATGIIEHFSIELKPFATMKPQMDDALIRMIPEGMPGPPEEPAKPSIFSRLEKDFGLLLRPGRARIERLRIESIEMPSPN